MADREQLLQRKIEELKRKREEAEAQAQNIAFKEYLHSYHYHLYNKFVLPDESNFSTGFTSVEAKYYPKWPRPWNSSTKT